MKITATVLNEAETHRAVVCTGGNSRSIEIPPKQTGRGSSVNGGELLMAALATCYCNDIYREAAKRKISVESVEIEAEAEFEAEGEPARAVYYRVRVKARASEDDIRALIMDTDKVAEIQNTVRAPTPVLLSSVEAITV
jgi:uncharacterized OsmC-like protein